jgi:DNA-binding LacI/PurR family transcriptional regulator
MLNLVAEGNLPVLAFDRKVTSGNFDFVAVDSRAGTLRAVDYLVALGHRKLGYVKGLKDTFSANERFESFTEALSKHGLPLNVDWTFEGDYTVAAGTRAAEKLLTRAKNNLPTAMLTANDLIAIGLMQKLQEAGWTLPDEMSIVGFDNIQWSEWTYPSLTTIAQPMRAMVKHASEVLVQRIIASRARQQSRPDPTMYTVEPTLLVRTSVTEPRTRQNKPIKSRRNI